MKTVKKAQSGRAMRMQANKAAVVAGGAAKQSVPEKKAEFLRKNDSIKAIKVTKKAQSGKKISKKSSNPADEYKGMKTPKGKPAKDVGGEGRRAPFKSGGKMKKCKGGC